MRLRSAVFLWIVGLFVLSPFALAETIDRIVAVVNGDVILYSELQEQIRQVSKISPEVANLDPSQRSQVEREILRDLIRERLAQQEVQRLKIVVTQNEVNEAIEAIKKENNFTDAQLNYIIQQSGQTPQQFRDGIRKELERSRLVERVLKSKTVITQQQVDAYLKSEGSGWREKRRLAVIFLPFPENAGESQKKEIEKLGKDLVNRVKGGADFAKLAKEYSRGPGAEQGGDIGYLADDELAPFIEKVVRGLKVDECSEPVVVPPGVYLIKVLDIQREKQSADDALAREKAQRQLFQQEVKRRFEDWVHDLESRSFIQIYL